MLTANRNIAIPYYYYYYLYSYQKVYISALITHKQANDQSACTLVKKKACAY